eukprot:IDg4818t1
MTGTENSELEITTTLSFTESTAVSLNTKKDLTVSVPVEVFMTADNPKVNGQTERFDHTIALALRHYVAVIKGIGTFIQTQ